MSSSLYWVGDSETQGCWWESILSPSRKKDTITTPLDLTRIINNQSAYCASNSYIISLLYLYTLQIWVLVTSPANCNHWKARWNHMWLSCLNIVSLFKKRKLATYLVAGFWAAFSAQEKMTGVITASAAFGRGASEHRVHYVLMTNSGCFTFVHNSHLYYLVTYKSNTSLGFGSFSL